ncbi:MAG TPA: hypothetical protein VFC00_29120 [Micromonosporaceae bacterium]|nr:hypothetical protein [Micromonosporaceae bacterium]
MSLFAREPPPPATPATRRLRALIAVTALATVLVDLINLEYAAEGGFGLTVRTIWALLRAIGFLVLMRTVRLGRMVSRPFGLILAATTVFASVRLAIPRSGALLPPWPVIAAVAVLIVLCGLVVLQLYASPAIATHLTRRPPRRPVPPWVLTARVAALSYGALLLVPALVAVGSLFDEPRLPRTLAIPLVLVWLLIAFGVISVMPWLGLFVLFDHGWARVLLGIVTVVLLAVQLALCLALLGVDGLVRDGGPMAVAAGLAAYALWRSRRRRSRPT